MTQSGDDQDSLSLQIGQPQNGHASQKKLPPLKDIQLKTTADHQSVKLFFTIHSTYIKNLLSRKERPNISNPLKTKLGQNAIIFKEFVIHSKEAKRFMGDDRPIKGHICLRNSQINIEVKVWFSSNVKKPEDFIWIVFNYTNYGIWRTKSYQFEDEDKDSSFTWKVPYDEFQDFMDPNVLLTVHVKNKEMSNTPELGIVNLGNTCYMNSCLQMLFYLRPLRKIILETKSNNKIIKQLRQVFIMLMDKEDNKPIDVENFLEAYEKYNEIPRRQQDVQEFLLDFINQIETECPEVKSMWEGKCSETTSSVEPGKHYNSVQNQEFAQLDVHLFDAKQRPFERIEDSLEEILKQEEVEDLIDHDEYGKIKVAKHRTFITLPDVLFVNLKRYQWSKQQMRLSKIFSPIKYGDTLNLGFIVGTPGSDDYNPDCDYTLYSVLVHKGTSPQNGHYFVFTNVSNNCDKPQWVCFNDSITKKSDPEEVLEFTGQKSTEISLDKENGRYVEKQIESDASSYLLVYIRKNVFNEYQGIKTSIPKDFLSEKLKRNSNQKDIFHDINVLLMEKYEEVDLFSSSLELIPIPMMKSSVVYDELKKATKKICGDEARLFYRVYAYDRVIKKIENYENTADLIKTRRGYPQLTYVLALTPSVPTMKHFLRSDDEIKPKQKGILLISKNEFQDDFKPPQFSLASAKDLQELQNEVDRRNGRIIDMTSRMDFQQKWCRYLQIQIVKNNN